MRKHYTVKPIPTIDIEFLDGYTITLRFDTIAMFHLSTEFELEYLLDKPSITEACAMIIYSASVENTEGMTIEKARELVACMDSDTILSVVKDFEESCGIDEINNTEVQKKTMREFIAKISEKKHQK